MGNADIFTPENQIFINFCFICNRLNSNAQRFMSFFNFNDDV